MLPNIQVYEKSSKVTLFWDVTSGYDSYNLYWSPTGIVGTFNLVKENIPNYECSGFKKATAYSFLRNSIGVGEKDTFYVAITGMTGVTESAMGSARIIAYHSDQMADGGAINSPITTSENISAIIGTTPIKITFTHDVKFMEIFNHSQTDILYVDVTGVEASVSKSMPVFPCTYYTVFRNLSAPTGVSFVSNGTVDARIVIHY